MKMKLILSPGYADAPLIARGGECVRMKYPGQSLPLVMQLNYSSERLLLSMGQPGLSHRGNKASPEPRVR